MKKYTDPIMSISLFQMENIITASGLTGTENGAEVKLDKSRTFVIDGNDIDWSL